MSIILIITTLYVFSEKEKDWKKEYLKELSEKKKSLNDKINIAGKYLNKANKLNDSAEIVNAYLVLGNLYLMKFDHQKSLESLLKAFGLSKGNANDKTIADICYKISGNYLDKGEYINAHEFAIRTDSIEKNNKLRSAETLNLLGNIYEKSGLYIKSLATHYESLELQKENNNLKGIANSYHNLANLYIIGERYDKAFTYYSKALGIYEKQVNSDSDSTNIQLSIAKINICLLYKYILRIKTILNA